MEKNAVGKGILSFIIPGVGQYFNHDESKALKMLIGMVVLHIAIYFIMNNVFGSAVSTLYHAYAGYDAYINHQSHR